MARPLRADLAAVFMAEFEPLVRTLQLVVGDRASAEDLAQEAFVRAFSRWRRIENYEDPAGWIRRVGLNLALNARRDRARRRALPQGETAIDQGFNDPDIVRALQTLPPKQRAAVVLCLVEERPAAEAARLIGCSESTVRVHLHRARQRLIELLGDAEESDVH